MDSLYNAGVPMKAYRTRFKLASQLDIDLGLRSHFSGSTDKAGYERVCVRPQAFQDDILRLAQNTASTRAGAIKLSSMLRERLIRCHPTKTCYIVIGNKKLQAAGEG